jgi:hypothetical protein
MVWSPMKTQKSVGVHFSTMQLCYGKSKIDDSDIVLFKCRCVPSHISVSPEWWF